jgi:methionyl-tRNA formyltransferase
MNLLVLSANEAAQGYFIDHLARQHSIAGVVVDQRYDSADRLRRLWRASDRNPFKTVANIARKLQLRGEETRQRAVYGQYFGDYTIPSHLRDVNVISSRNINSHEVAETVRGLNPDVMVVFGTRLLKLPLIDAADTIVNIHTGLSPYYRGGHSTFFALYNNEPEYVGVTIHYIEPGIDSGNIILSGRPEIEATDDLYTLECKVIVLGTQLMLEALRRISEGTVEGVAQWTDGKLYYSRDYTLQRRLEWERRWLKSPPLDQVMVTRDASAVRVVE